MNSSTIQITTPDGSAEALLVRADDADHPGLLMYPDAIGLRPAFEQMAERVASWGYTVLVPNYFYRIGTAEQLAPGVALRSAEGPAEMARLNFMERIQSVTPAHAISDAGVFVDALRAAPGVAKGPIGTTGYCFGGLQAIRAAETRPDAVAAVGAYHTGRLVSAEPESVHRHFGDARAEFYLGHADQDASATPENIAEVERALTDAGLPYTSELYPGARHGYAVLDTPAFEPEASKKHFETLRALLSRALG